MSYLIRILYLISSYAVTLICHSEINGKFLYALSLKVYGIQWNSYKKYFKKQLKKLQKVRIKSTMLIIWYFTVNYYMLFLKYTNGSKRRFHRFKVKTYTGQLMVLHHETYFFRKITLIYLINFKIRYKTHVCVLTTFMSWKAL